MRPSTLTLPINWYPAVPVEVPETELAVLLCAYHVVRKNPDLEIEAQVHRSLELIEQAMNRDFVLSSFGALHLKRLVRASVKKSHEILREAENEHVVSERTATSINVQFLRDVRKEAAREMHDPPLDTPPQSGVINADAAAETTTNRDGDEAAPTTKRGTSWSTPPLEQPGID